MDHYWTMHGDHGRKERQSSGHIRSCLCACGLNEGEGREGGAVGASESRLTRSIQSSKPKMGKAVKTGCNPCTRYFLQCASVWHTTTESLPGGNLADPLAGQVLPGPRMEQMRPRKACSMSSVRALRAEAGGEVHSERIAAAFACARLHP